MAGTSKKVKKKTRDRTIHRPFTVQCGNLNNYISSLRRNGTRTYISVDELKQVYDRYGGVCGYCGLELTSISRRVNTCKFQFKIPLEAEGSLDLENLFPVCPTCKREKVPKRPVAYPIFDYNAFSDIMVQLVRAVIEKDQEKIQYFKYQLDSSLSEYIGILFYRPVGTPKKIGIPPEGKKMHMSELAISLTNEIQRILKEITYEKEYRPVRENNNKEGE